MGDLGGETLATLSYSRSPLSVSPSPKLAIRELARLVVMAAMGRFWSVLASPSLLSCQRGAWRCLWPTAATEWLAHVVVGGDAHALVADPWLRGWCATWKAGLRRDDLCKIWCPGFSLLEALSGSILQPPIMSYTSSILICCCQWKAGLEVVGWGLPSKSDGRASW